MYYRIRTRSGKAEAFDEDIEIEEGEWVEMFCDLSDINMDKFAVKTLRFDIYDECPACPSGWIDYDPDGCLCYECGFEPDWVWVTRRWRWNPAPRRSCSRH